MARGGGAAAALLALLVLGSHAGAYAQEDHDRDRAYKCFPAIFSLGDDWADTGNARTLYPTDLEAQEEVSPYGMTFFKSPAHRLSDGRLMIDFLAQAFGMPLLSSYTTGVVSNLRHGISFAVAGSTASFSDLKVPYPLLIQVQWVDKFQSDVLDALATGTTQPLPDPAYFRTALYVISTGQNDYRYALQSGAMSVADVEFTVVPQVVENITASIALLAENLQARKFLVISVPPVGCTPEMLTLFASTDPLDYDDNGCLRKLNRLSELHNELLAAAVDRMRVLLSLQDPSYNITFVDMYSIMTEVLYDPPKRGFSEPLLACCGAKEPYNFHEKVMCGRRMLIQNSTVLASACSNPREYISWDGIHTTEAFNRYAVNSILEGRYVLPGDAFRCYSAEETDDSTPVTPSSPPPGAGNP
ncbi:GDSL esterase/lipase At4g01130 [Selaginella moellendorffii]|uniref:GDSL esterase/lipase At4g01130 n=1 Tax=Selaginella moellendorffii TaxID=88036 RepID=UPI000D1C5F3D|nr:GDSL esterase/lipase At4g01130 [Selaginella moellendorffii]|eukprot:XP_024516563.1 GDSL esterase/lipase At4g01130 [Selaginella moellendorffii]